MCMQFTIWQRRCALLVVAAFCWPVRVGAQQPSEPAVRNAQINVAPADKNYLLRTYEVGDLTLSIQDHPYSESLQRVPVSPGGGGLEGGGGGFFSVPDNVGVNVRDATARLQLCQFGGGGGGRGGGGSGIGNESQPAASITIDDLLRVLTTTIASDSWAENGGEGQVESLGTALVVWQTPAVHDQIEELLKQVRQGSADRKSVTIDARWLLLNSDELDILLLKDQEAVGQVDRKVLAEFTRRPGSIRGMTNCFSSQLVYLVSGTMRNFVQGYIPVVGSLESPRRDSQFASRRGESLIRFVSDTPAAGGGNEPQVGYQPIVGNSNFGALLEIRPTLVTINHPEPMVVVDLKSTITVPGEQPVPGGNAESGSIAPQVDRIAIETQEFATTVRIPLGKPVLVGGLTYIPRSTGLHEADGATAENPQLYFVLEVR